MTPAVWKTKGCSVTALLWADDAASEARLKDTNENTA
jgi:hypothetical protein